MTDTVIDVSLPNLEHIKLWTDALRSGEYSQATKKLRTGEGFCCLGVACDVYQKATGLGEWRKELFVAEEGKSSTVLPVSVMQWLGLSNNSAMHKPKDEIKTSSDMSYTAIALFDMNDNLHWDFNKIADYIDANVDILNNLERKVFVLSEDK